MRRFFAPLLALFVLATLSSACQATTATVGPTPTPVAVTADGGDGSTIGVTPDLGTPALSYSAPIAPGSYVPQVYAHAVRANQWIKSQGAAQGPTGKFNMAGLYVDHYDSVRLLLFTPGTFNAVYDHTYAISFDVVTTETPITAPVYALGTPYKGPAGNMRFPWSLKWPSRYPWPAMTVIVMAKANHAFAQASADLTKAKYGTDPYQDIAVLSGELVSPETFTGVDEVQGGAFNPWSWQLWSNWVWPGPLYEPNGTGWMSRCDPAQRPTVTSALKHVQNAMFSVGGNIGNYSIFGLYGTYANYADVAYLKALKAQVGCTWLRENIDPNQYLDSLAYRDIIRSHAEAMWQKGIVPMFAPQDEPIGDTIAARDAALIALDTQLARDYADAADNVMLENLNEPYLHPTWKGDWSNLAQRTLLAMIEVNPHARLICATEGYELSVAAANAAPLPAFEVTAYDVHGYMTPSQLPAAAGGKVPVLISEYHDTTLRWMAYATHVRNVIGVGAWAWDLETPTRQDSIALVHSWDGKTLTLTPDGAAIAQWSRVYEGR